jgi:hypothetical protein
MARRMVQAELAADQFPGRLVGMHIAGNRAIRQQAQFAAVNRPKGIAELPSPGCQNPFAQPFIRHRHQIRLPPNAGFEPAPGAPHLAFIGRIGSDLPAGPRLGKPDRLSASETHLTTLKKPSVNQHPKFCLIPRNSRHGNTTPWKIPEFDQNHRFFRKPTEMKSFFLWITSKFAFTNNMLVAKCATWHISGPAAICIIGF